MSQYKPLKQADGTEITYEEVTAKLKATYDKLNDLGRQAAIARKFNPDYWFLHDDLKDTVEAMNYCAYQMKLLARGFDKPIKENVNE